MLLLALLTNLAHAAEVPDGTVVVGGDVWRSLQEPIEPEAKLPTPVVERRDVVLRWDGDVLRYRAVWRLRAWEEAWFSQVVTGRGLRVERIQLGGRRIPLAAENGSTRVTGRIDGVSTLVVDGTVDGNPTERPLALPLLPALAGTIRVVAPEGLEGRITGDGVTVRDVTWTGAPQVQVQVGPPVRKARDRRTLAVASTGVGLTVGDGAVEGRARVRWALRQGRLDRVRLQVTGVGTDLDVSGPNVARVDRRGDRIDVQLRTPEEALVELDLRWTVPVPAGDVGRVPLPRIVPQDAFRTEASLQIARDGELEVLPDLTAWTPVASVDLPSWGEGLVAGTPTAAYSAGSAGRDGSLGLLRFVPVSGPPVVVDVASLTIAASVEGRTLTRALYTVRNERGAHLRIRPPASTLIVGARVQDGPVTPVADGDAWLVPLPRSLETVDGLLSFPVEVVFLGDGSGWSRREARDVSMPVVDAPVAVNRVTLHLPPVFAPELETGQHGLVDDFTEGEGIAYGFGLGGQDEAMADQKWQDAMGAWMRNDFDEADELLDELEGMGAANENLGRLRSNLDVVQGRTGTETVGSRRIVDQAKSRALDDYREQERILKEAEEEYEAGDYTGSSAKYKKAAKLSEKLDKLEQKESVEQKRMNRVANRRAEEAAQEARLQQSVRSPAPPDPTTATVEASEAVLDVPGIDMSGLLTLSPDEPSAVDDLAGPSLFDEDFDTAEDVGDIFGHELIEDDGVEGGVVGGVVGGAVGGALGGVAAAPSDTTVSESEIQRAPRRVIKTGGRIERDRRRSRAEVSAVEIASSGGGRGRGIRLRRRADKAPAPPPPPPAARPSPAEEPVVAFGRDEAGAVDSFDFDGDDIAGELVQPEANLLLDGRGIADTQGTFEALQVTSTRLSVVVPVLGETLRYQHLLLPAGAEHSVHVEARGDRSVPRRPE